MAARFWVTGGTGNWNSTTNWSTTSGGASGASVPGSADTATFNASSGSGTITLDISPTIQTLTCTGFTGTLAFGTNTISLNSTGTIFTGATTMTVTGTPLIICTNSSATSRTITTTAVIEANSISFRVTAGTGTFGITSGGSVKDLDFTDGTNPTGYAGALGNSAVTIYGNFKASTGMTRTAGAQIYTFAATSGTKTINTAGVTFDCPFTFNGVGGTWSLQSALSLGSSRTLTLTNGTLTTNGYAVAVGIFSSNNTNVRTLNLGASTFTVNGTGNAWNVTDPTNMTLNAGTSTIVTTGNSATVIFLGGGLTYYNLTFGASYYNSSLSGTNTFNNLTITPPAGVGRRALTLNANQTVVGTLTTAGSAANVRVRITGAATGTTLTAATVSALSDVDFNGIIAAGVSAPWSGTRLGNMGGNTNINFEASKTVYWNQPAGGNWSDVAWATSSGGTVNINNFPLAQDTAILDNTGVGAASTIAMDYGWSLPEINASSLTNTLTINWNCFGNLTASVTGPITLSGAVSFTFTQGALGINFVANNTITTAGVSFPMNVSFNSYGYTMTLADNFTSTGRVSHPGGTLDLNGKTLTCDNFVGTFTELLTRVIAFNGGQINVTGNAQTVWACSDLTNFSYTGTPTVNFTYSGSTGTRSVANGAIGLTEANAVDFNIVAGGDTWASSGTPNGVRNWTFQSAFTGSSSFYASGFIYGNVLLSPNQTITAGAVGPTFAATSGTKTITTNGVTIDRPITFNGQGGSWILGSDLTLAATTSSGTLTFIRGTFSTGNYNVSAARWYYDYLTVIGTVVLNLGSSTITLIPSSTPIPWQMGGGGTSFPLTVNGGTSNIVFNTTVAQASMNPNNAATVTYYKVTQAGTNNLLINDGITLDTLQNTAQPTTITFNNIVTEPYVIDNFNVSGTAGNLVTLASKVPGSRFLLVKPEGGTVSVSYCSISDSNAYRTGDWFALTSQGNVDGGNNRGWYFAPIGTRISQLLTKAERQTAKLALAAVDRAAEGNTRNILDITQLPTVYSTASNNTNLVVNNPNPGGLIYGRPWI